jgi:hypothetical protein
MAHGFAMVTEHPPAHTISDALMFVVENGQSRVEDDAETQHSAAFGNYNFFSEEKKLIVKRAPCFKILSAEDHEGAVRGVNCLSAAVPL